MYFPRSQTIPLNGRRNQTTAFCVSPAKVAELEHGGLRIQQQILGLDVPMTDPKRMDVGQAPEQLIHVQLRTETHTGYDYTGSKLGFHYRV